jgi:hypothetical protein
MEPLTSSFVHLSASTSFEAARTKRLVDPIRTLIQSPTKTCSTEMRFGGNARDKGGESMLITVRLLERGIMVTAVGSNRRKVS